jgi:hypothetical protein
MLLQGPFLKLTTLKREKTEKVISFFEKMIWFLHYHTTLKREKTEKYINDLDLHYHSNIIIAIYLCLV